MEINRNKIIGGIILNKLKKNNCSFPLNIDKIILKNIIKKNNEKNLLMNNDMTNEIISDMTEITSKDCQ